MGIEPRGLPTADISSMSLFTRSTIKLLSRSQFQGCLVITSTRNAGLWNKDFKPGQTPKSEEERIKAAKKYGLHPDEYQVFPDDGINNAGDYDFPEHRRYWGEPIHKDFTMYDLTRIDTTPPRFSMTQQLVTFLSVMAGFFAAYFYLDAAERKSHWPLLPKQMPGDGKVHYTFEPAESAE